MIKWILISLSFFLILKSRADEPSKPKVVYKKSELHKFSGLKLKGQLKKPELSYIYKRKGLRVEQIVNIPENFDDKIIEERRHF